MAGNFTSFEECELLYKGFIENMNLYSDRKNLDLSKLKVLDIGSGKGRLVLYLRSLGIQAFGVETNSKNLKISREHAQKLGLEESIFIGERLEELTPDTYDVVCHMNVLEHLSGSNITIDNFLDNATRVLKKDGLYLAEIPNILYPKEGHCNLWFIHWFPGYYLKYFYAKLIKNKDAWKWAKAITDEIEYLTSLSIYIKHKKRFKTVKFLTIERLLDSTLDSIRRKKTVQFLGYFRKYRLLRVFLIPFIHLVASVRVQAEGKLL